MAKSSKKAARRRSFNRISYKERVIIENRYCIDRKRISEIAKELGRPLSSIIREIRGKPRIGRGRYSADVAQAKAEKNRDNQGRKTKFDHEPLCLYVLKKLKLGWSPEQIAIRLPIEYPEDERMRISHEAVYQYVYDQIYREGNGQVKPGREDLRKYLARRHKRRQKKGFRKAQKAERDLSLPSIESRPREADERVVVGHWEGDTVVSKQSDHRIKSVNERVSGVVFFGKTPDGSAKECDKVTIARLIKTYRLNTERL
ncbi:IS30 family transposase [Candidatus Parcubacteria bacterium]|nr:MAG: IS30 family transposase [Candidatus Parcubacteria bacterium]